MQDHHPRMDVSDVWQNFPHINIMYQEKFIDTDVLYPPSCADKKKISI